MLFQRSKNLARNEKGLVCPHMYLGVTLIRVAKHLLLPLQHPPVLVNHYREGLSNESSQRLRRLGTSAMFHPAVENPPPDEVRLVYRRVRVVQHIPSLRIRTELPRRRDTQLDSGQPWVHHMVGVIPIDHVVTEPVHEVRRLLILRSMPDLLDGLISADVLLDDLDRDPAVRDVPDVAVVKRIKMGDIE